MANVFTTWRDSVTAAYAAAGYTVTSNPATVNPPCVVVGPIESIESASLLAWDVKATVWLVHPAPAASTAFDWLEGNLPPFIANAPAHTSVELTTYAHPSGDLPAYRCNIDTTIQE